jgi:hypothetical protein
MTLTRFDAHGLVGRDATPRRVRPFEDEGDLAPDRLARDALANTGTF